MNKKTIFVSLSDTNVFRNLFFFPESFFHIVNQLLKEQRDLTIVYIIPPGTEKFKIFLEQQPDKLYAIEEVFWKGKKHESFLQRVFYFFYSYFIYTGTTKMLATMGMRPDEPPGGGKRYLAPLKMLIAKTFGRSRLMREKVVPYFYYKVYQERPFYDVFEKYHPDLVFTPTLFVGFDQLLLAEAKRRGIQTVGMISNWDHFDKYYLPFRPDRLLAQSEQIKKFALLYQSYEPESITITGYPQFDFIANPKYAVPREECLKRLGFSPKSKYIAYVSGSAYCPDEPDIIEKILEWAKAKKFGSDVRLFIRPYLGRRSVDREFDEKKYNRFRNHPLVTFYDDMFWGDVDKSAGFFNVLRHADVLVINYSTMILEAAVFDRPLVTIMFDGNASRPFHRSVKRFALREHFADIFQIGGVAVAKSFKDLYKIIDTYIKNPGLDREKRKRMCDDLLYKIDMSASQRIVDAIMKQ